MCLSTIAGNNTAGVQDKLNKSTSFRVVLTGKHSLFSYYDKAGNLTGFNVDISNEITKRLGRKPEIITNEWDSILAGLLADKYDAIIDPMAITPERSKAEISLLHIISPECNFLFIEATLQKSIVLKNEAVKRFLQYWVRHIRDILKKTILT